MIIIIFILTNKRKKYRIKGIKKIESVESCIYWSFLLVLAARLLGVAVKFSRAYKIARGDEIERSHFCTRAQSCTKTYLHEWSLLQEQTILHGVTFAQRVTFARMKIVQGFVPDQGRLRIARADNFA